MTIPLFVWPMLLASLLIAACFLSTAAALFLEPSVPEDAGHCYHVEARSWYLYLAGTRRFEIPCP
jgi:hypothetical protein